MKKKQYLWPLFLLMAIVWLGVALVTNGTADAEAEGVCPRFARVVQRGELIITIPAEETAAFELVQITPCPDMNIQVTGGSMLNTPIVINGNVHQDWLILNAYLLEPQPGPMDVTVWWRLD